MVKEIDRTVSVEDFFNMRSRRISLMFISVLTVALLGFLPILFLVVRNIPAGIGTLVGLVFAGLSLLLVLKGRQKVGNSLFFFMCILILMGIAASSMGAGDNFPVVIISVVAMTFVLIFPTGVLIGLWYTAAITFLCTAGLSLVIFMSGNQLLIQRIPLFAIIYFFGGAIVFSLSRIQNDLLSQTMAEARKNRESLQYNRSVFENVQELRAGMEAGQKAIADELAGIEELLDTYADKIKAIAGGSSELSDRLTASGRYLERLEKAVSTITEGIAEQTALVNRSVGEQERIHSSVREMCERIRVAELANQELEESAAQGRSEVESVARSISALEDSQKQMSEVNRVITRIASQTNMLAMNASIEAAHAGEYGHGFAVVADEVRNLSDESNRRSKEISLLIKTMNGMMKESVGLVERSGESLRRISEKADTSSPIIREVYAGMQDYSTKLSGILTDNEELVGIARRMDDHAQEETGIFREYEHIFGDLNTFSRTIIQGMEDLAETGRKAYSILEKIDVVRKESETMNRRVEELLARSRADG